jgi:hypothetical protein
MRDPKLQSFLKDENFHEIIPESTSSNKLKDQLSPLQDRRKHEATKFDKEISSVDRWKSSSCGSDNSSPSLSPGTIKHRINSEIRDTKFPRIRSASPQRDGNSTLFPKEVSNS